MIKIAPETIFKIGNISITNTLLTSWLVIFIIFLFLIFVKYQIKPNKLQILLEIIYENIYKFWFEITHLKSKLIFTFCLTFLIYIGLSNLIILIPPLEAFYIKKNDYHLHLFRSVFSDLNMTLALALISVFLTNFLGLLKSGLRFFKRFFSPIGILELISEFAKIISFSFRLFGNIFAGKVLLVVISSLVVFFIPSFFIGLEIFVGLIQAFIFFVLTSVFIKVAIEH
ncbi:MAG: F0F1 ATP synthase subunit A [Patescibacteria group bacterium]|nr:F0F1 ATP synthase subunit A [Patescibacteria group bacterium]